MTASFDSTEVNTLSRALERAWQELQGSRMLDGEGEATAKVALSKAIIEAAGLGTRDEAALAAYAISHYPHWRDRVLDDEMPPSS